MLTFPKSKRLVLPLAILISLSGCSVMRSYDDELSQTVTLVGQGNVDQALTQLDSNNTSTEKDLLYYMEKSELLRLNKKYKDSISTSLLADHLVDQWENEAKIRLGAVAETAGSVLLNDKTRRYDGHDYEKVMLSTRLAVTHLLNGDWDSARTEVKKTHEREAIIAELRAKETEELEKESKAKGITTTFKDLNGYPIETLNAPEVTALKNGYQSAFSHYLAGFVYETLNEPGLAAPGYRQAAELQPNVKVLEDGLAGLETRSSLLKPGETDVLFVVEAGSAPARKSITIPVPVIVNNLGVIPISFPILRSEPNRSNALTMVTIDGNNNAPLATITSLDTMSKRALKDDIPGIIVRGIIRAGIKATSQKLLMDQGGGAAIAGIALNVANVVTESADERTWRTLPGTISVARATIPSGSHELSLPGVANKQTVDIKGSHAIVVVRQIGNQVYWSQPLYGAKLPDYATVSINKSPDEADNLAKKKTAKKKKSSKKKSSKSSQ